MNRREISDAVGNISTRHIQEAQEPSRKTVSAVRRLSVKKLVALVAALAVCLTLALPALAAADVDAAYDILYAASPKIAQQLKPVRLSCEDNGIRMEVISAHIDGDRAEIYLSLQDMTGDRVDPTTDLFDSYRINRPFDSSATCRSISYDEESGKATFLITITQWGEQDIGGDKITFTVSEFLSHKQEFHEALPQELLSGASLASPTQTDVKVRGGSWTEEKGKAPEYSRFLVPSENSFSPVEGVTVTAVGFVEGKLRIQAHYQNILETDNHGSFHLVNADGQELYSEASVSFWDDTSTGSYEEYIFDVSADDLSGYTLYGDFWTCGSLTKGNWQVTFPLEYQPSSL